MNGDDLAALRGAVDALEKSGVLSSVTHFAGKKFAFTSKFIPARIRATASRVAKLSLEAAMNVALRSLQEGRHPASSVLHKVAITATGAVGGAFGLAAIPIELPASTVIMLRSIAAIARASGEDLTDRGTALACLEVFALGGRTEQDDHLDSAYFAVRLALAEGVSEASHYLSKGVIDLAAPPIIRLISMIASRYGVVLSQKMAAQAVPVVGALGGAMINLGFIHHLEQIAQGHFTVRRLERQYGADFIRAEYDRLRLDLLSPAPAPSPA